MTTWVIPTLSCVLAAALLFPTFQQEPMALAAARARNIEVSLRGKTAVVVGGTSGIGRGISVRLAKAGAAVTIVGRSAKRGEAVLEEMRAAAPPPAAAGGGDGDGAGDGKDDGVAPPTFNFVPCNCFVLANVGACVDGLLENPETSTIDYLVQTQGMATIQVYTSKAVGERRVEGKRGAGDDVRPQRAHTRTHTVHETPSVSFAHPCATPSIRSRLVNDATHSHSPTLTSHRSRHTPTAPGLPTSLVHVLSPTPLTHALSLSLYLFFSPTALTHCPPPP